MLDGRLDGAAQTTPSGVLFAFACGTNNRYSMAWWEEAFYEVGLRVVGAANRIHFGYTSFDGGLPDVPAHHTVHFDSSSRDWGHLNDVAAYVRRHDIRLVFGFDFPVHRRAYAVIRRAGVRAIISYWGAPMSGPYRGLRLLIRRAKVLALGRHQPDHYIFQATAMAKTAEYVGVSRARISVCRSGVDEERYAPPAALTTYAHDLFKIPRDRKIVLYAGHLSERKGIRVILRAAQELADRQGRRDLHFLLLGEDTAEAQYRPLLAGTEADEVVTFGGYRQDMPRILQSIYVGLRPSTGWDSFPVSCMEMTSAGVPLITSDQGGLPEMVDDGVTGRVLPAGDHMALAMEIAALADDPIKRGSWSSASRQRILSSFTRTQFVERLSALVQRVWAQTE